MARAIKGLTTFRDLELPDLRVLESEFRLDPTPEIEAGDSLETAVTLLELHMGFTEPEMLIVPKETIIGTLNILRDKLEHIVEKRLDARERYVLLALDTLANPYEVWETMYDDEQVRFLFIGAYRQKQQMLVVVAPWEGKVLWNFMHTDAKSLNKHRQGTLLYKRH
ncbi:hypothetical protein RZ019_004612 [Salmonella enterica]|uniref:PBECR2 nuclease fold domain-containing protein n=1 Tax=Enterobacteriaceae TaxID=543 RepID=UPI000CFD4849|nr:PBECR2 nuclease fold domain-containing protein [Cronobacter sakazakii]EAC0613671.1 hypothetical protein [Salmonella enterica subsp. enterica]ECP5779669.1 hypothetical protein [Salmonella enterica]EIX9086536.1 hypothetical protein [Klebsiella aerogenes]HED9551214.1 hypothetical protein [Klebsiella pneumoniae]EEL5305698.1 hypothetical protein [Salmonella enterica]